MFVITIKVKPEAGTDLEKEAGGAYAVCWVDFARQEGAELLAKFYIEQDGWTPLEIKRTVTVDEEFYDTHYKGEERDELKQYYAEAEEEGICMVFYGWPVDAEDAQEEEGAW